MFDEEIVASNSAIHDELLEVIERNWQRQDRENRPGSLTSSSVHTLPAVLAEVVSSTKAIA